MKNKSNSKETQHLYKNILNSLYGITSEGMDERVDLQGYRNGDDFNRFIARYISAIVRTNLIIQNGGKVYLNMTDSIIYQDGIILDILDINKVRRLKEHE